MGRISKSVGAIIVGRIKLISETAWHHDGDFYFFKELVSTIAKETKADYIKFHVTLNVNEYMHKDHPGYNWVKNSIFSESQWVEIINITTHHDKKPMLLFNDTKAIDFGMKLDPELVEIHSTCLNDVKLLRHLKANLKLDTKVVLGIGGTDLYEVENAIQTIGTENVILMHGFQNYPTKYEDINFLKVKRIMELFPQYKHGYADHTAWNHEHNILITLLGASLGMDYIEKHVTISTGEGKTDWQAAINIETFIKLTEMLNIVEETYGNGYLKLNEGEKAYSTFGIMKKAAILIHDIRIGDKLKLEHLSFKRTDQQSDLSQLDVLNIIGKTVRRNLLSGHCVNRNDFK